MKSLSDSKSKQMEHANSQMENNKEKGEKVEYYAEENEEIARLKIELKNAKEDNVQLQTKNKMHGRSLAKDIYEIEGLIHSTR